MVNHIRERRKALGLSQIQLASRLVIAQGTLSNLELGKWEPWPKVRGDLALALNTTEEDLFPKSQGRSILTRLLGNKNGARHKRKPIEGTNDAG